VRHLVETQGVERKQSLSEKKEGLASLNAMVNADSAVGVVLFGVSPHGAIVGVEPGDVDKAQRSLAQHIRAKFSPAVCFEIEAVDCDGKWIVAVRAERDRRVPLLEYDGRAYIREGSGKRQLELAEKLQIIHRRNRDSHSGPWRCDRCGSLVGQLVSVESDGQTMRKTYGCDCGGEYWPVT